MSDQLNAHFGGGAGLAGLRDRFRHDGTATVLSEAEREQLRALGRDAVLTGAQDEHLANDLRIDLDAIGNDGPPWYPYIDAGMGAITEIAAHVLVHARHQAGGSGLHDILDAVTAHFGGEPALGSGMVAGTITERNVLEQVAEQVVARVQARVSRRRAAPIPNAVHRPRRLSAVLLLPARQLNRQPVASTRISSSTLISFRG